MQQLLLIFLILATTHDYGRGQVIARLVKAEGRVYFKRLEWILSLKKLSRDLQLRTEMK